MQEQITRKFLLGFISIHILHHAKEEPIFGSWMLDELKHHGYDISPGTLYPILHSLESHGLLSKEDKVVEGKVRKYYSITQKGEETLQETIAKAKELFDEIK